MPDVALDPAKALDPVPRRTGRTDHNRDTCRTPMQWSDEPGAGFTTGDAEPWLPIGDAAARNVDAQRADAGSPLHLARDLIAVRRERDDLRSGSYETLAAPAGAWAYRRGDGTAVALNLSGSPVAVDGLSGRVLVATDRARDGATVDGALELAAWEAAVIALDA
jgi:alpha-glucosidase